MKRILKKVCIPIVLITFILFAFSITGIKKSNASSGDIKLGDNDAYLRFVFTKDAFVSSDNNNDGKFDNEIEDISDLGSNKEFYLTIFFTATNVRGISGCWVFDSSEVASVTNIMINNSAGINSITGGNRDGSYYEMGFADFLPKTNGRDSDTYIEGNATLPAYGEFPNHTNCEISNQQINFVFGDATVSGTFVLCKAKVKLVPSATAFNLKVKRTDGNTSQVFDVTDINDVSHGLTADQAAPLDISLDSGALHTSVDTAVTVLGSATGDTQKTGTLKPDNQSLEFTVASDSTTADLTLSVDGGCGEISNVQGATGSGPYTVSLPNRNQFVTVTFTATAQDTSAPTQNYTVKIKRAPISTKVLNTVNFTKATGATDPIITANNVSSPSTSNALTLTNLTGGGTYKLWVSNAETATNVVATYNAASATINGTAYSSNGSAVTVQKNSGSVVIKLKAEDDSEDTYTFNFATITSNTDLTGVTTLTATGNSIPGATSTSNTSNHTYAVSIPYSDSNGNKIESVSFQFAANSGSSLSYGTNAASLSAINAGARSGAMAIDQQGNLTFIVRVKDDLTQEYQDWTVNVTRAGADQDTSLASSDAIIVDGERTTTTDGTNYKKPTSYEYDDTQCSITVKLNKNTSVWYFKANQDSNYRYTAELETVSGGSANFTFDNSGTRQSGDFSIVIVVKAQDANYTKEYTLTIHRDGADSNATIDTDNLKLSYTLNSATTNVAWTYNASNKTFTITNNIPYKVNLLGVMAHLNTTKQQAYKISSDFDLISKNGTSDVKDDIAIGDANHKNQYNFTITLYIKAQDNTEGRYYIKGTRDGASTVNTIDTTSLVTTNETPGKNSAVLSGSWNSAGDTYTISPNLPYLTTKVGIKVDLTDALSTMTINNEATASGVKYVYEIPSSTTTQTYSVNVVVTAEDGTPKTYKVEFTRNAPDTNNQVNAADIVVTDNNSNTYTGTFEDVTPTSATYHITGVPYSVNDLNVAVNNIPPLAKAYYDNSSAVWDGTAKSWTIGTASDVAAITKTKKFKIVSESNATFTYTIKVDREPGNAVNTATITVKGNSSGQVINPYTPSNPMADHLYYYVSLITEGKGKIEVSVTDPNAKAYLSETSANTGYSSTPWSSADNLVARDINKVYYIKIVPEVGEVASKVYTVHLDQADERDTDATLKTFYLEDSNGNQITPTSGSFTAGDATATLTYDLPYGIGVVKVTADPTKPVATVYADQSKNPKVASFDVSTLTGSVTQKVLNYWVQAENESWSPSAYKIIINRLAGSKDAGLNTLTVNGQTPHNKADSQLFTPEVFTSSQTREFEVNLGSSAYGVASNLVATPKGTNATMSAITKVGSLATDKKEVNQFTVTSEDGTTIITYKVTIYTADTSSNLSVLNVYDAEESDIQSFNGENIPMNPVNLKDTTGNVVYTHGTSTSPVTATIAYGDRNVFFEFKTQSTNAKVKRKIGSNYIDWLNQTITLQVGNNTIEYVVYSEYDILSNSNPSNTYVFNLKVNQADTENRLATFVASVSGTPIPASDITFSPDSNNIIIQNVGTTSGVMLKIDVTKMSQASKVIMPGGSQDSLTHTRPLQWTMSTESFDINVYAEGSTVPRVYSVTVYSGEVNASQNNDLGTVKITNAVNATAYYSNVPTGQTEALAEVVTLPLKVNNLNVLVGLPGGSLATPYLKVKAPGQSTYAAVTLDASGMYNLPVTPSTTVDVDYYLEVYATSHTGSEGQHYFIKIVVPKCSDVNTIDNVIIDGTQYIPQSDTETYAIPDGKTNIPFGVTPTDPDSTVTFTPKPGSGVTFTPNPGNPDEGQLSGLQPGPNEVTIKVEPTSGGTPKEYTITVWVNEDTKLATLEVVDHTMDPAFLSSHLTYDVEVKYITNSAVIKYTLPTTTDVNKVKVQYRLGNDNTLYSFNSALEATVDTTNSVVVTVIISQNYNGATPANLNSVQSSSTEYTINLNKKGASNDCDLLTINDGQTQLQINAATPVVIKVLRTQPFIDLTNITHNGKSYTLTATKTATKQSDTSYRVTLGQGEATTVTVTVQAENPNKSKSYTYVIVAADTDKEVGNIELLDATLNNLVDLDNKSLVFAAQTQYYGVFTVANTTNIVKLRITKPQYATLVIDGAAISSSVGQTTYIHTVDLTNYVSPTEKEVKVQINSESYVAYGQNVNEQSIEYSVKVTRQPLDTCATLKTLEANVPGMSGNQITGFVADQAGADFIITNVGDATSITVTATPTKNTSTVAGTGTLRLESGSDAENSYAFSFPIVCTAEDGITKEIYNVKVYRGPFNASADNKLTGLEVHATVEGNDTYYIANEPKGDAILFNVNTETYEITIPYGPHDYKIDASKVKGSPATIKITDATGAVKSPSSGSLTVPITPDMYGKTITHSVYATSESGVDGTKYQVKVTLVAPKTDNTLSSLTADGEELLDPNDPSKTVFTLTRPNSATSINIAAMINDPTATISDVSDLGNLPLQEGLNTFTVVVKSQAGVDKTYTINVTRAHADPDLLDLGVNGERLLDADGKAVSFDPAVTEYSVKLIFSHDKADIYALSSDTSDTITGTGVFPVEVGTSTFTVTIINLYGNKKEYNLTITRLPSETTNANLSEVEIFELDLKGTEVGPLTDKTSETPKVFNDEFKPFIINYGPYHVNNKITSLKVDATPEIANSTADYEAAKVQVYGHEALKVGKNNVVILVTAPDGETTKAYVIEVVRDELDFEVDQEQIAADGFTVEEVTPNGEYKLSIGKKKTSEVDFKKYIKDLKPEEQVLDVEILSDISTNPNEVLVKVTTDNDETQIVKFIIDSTGNPTGLELKDFIPLFIILGIVIIILTCILIAVNKDKYGKITRKADKKSDKQQQADSR